MLAPPCAWAAHDVLPHAGAATRCRLTTCVAAQVRAIARKGPRSGSVYQGNALCRGTAAVAVRRSGRRRYRHAERAAARALDLDRRRCRRRRPFGAGSSNGPRRIHGQLARWGWAQLDEDARPERFAVVCGDNDSSKQTLLIEDTPRHRWSTEFEVDGRNSCVPGGSSGVGAATRRRCWSCGSATTAAAIRRRLRYAAACPPSCGPKTNVQHFHGESSCYDDVFDYDRLERHLTTCALGKDDVVADKRVTRGRRSSSSTARPAAIAAASATATCPTSTWPCTRQPSRCESR